ncbi:hypothetical protein H7K45_12435 [Mycobacterium yunnanensis]|uniref:Uncharacterized protein n=1 Tax=Mycobacterium yunnanensis TaxID=368477 RepID=A0A9X2Z1U4_9MYCO|nr:hypothetical protein [Mycobacterium yunnanensis]MCV7421351.1 hypothetical protein [Mycobacterium yunnanensis]
MDLVLGLSLTTTALRWVLVEGTTGEGDPVDRGELDITEIDDVDPDLLARAVLNPDVIAGRQIRVVGVTSTAAAEGAASAVVDAFAARGHVVPVSDAAAVAALADGVAALTDYDDVAVCIVEPDSAFVAVVAAGEVTVEHVARPADRADAIELTSSVVAALDRALQAVFVIGSDDVAVIVSAVEAVTTAPVFSATEADLALARGAALVAGRTVDGSAPRVSGPWPWLRSRTGALTAVLAAAVVTLVVSSALAIGLTLSPPEPATVAENSSAAQRNDPVVAPPPPARPVVGLAEMANSVAKTMVVAAPPAPQPEYVAPPVAPPPAYVPPAPVYVPPPRQPRLRDRIIDRIPIIGRFHEPGQ